MPIPAAVSGAVINIIKKKAFEIGKKMLHPFIDSITGNTLGEIISYRKQEGNNNVLLFVHGFSGSASETFGCTPDMLVKNESFDGWDVFSIGYSSDIFPSIGKGLWSVNPDIAKVALYLKTLLENQFDEYSRIAFVAHSMGGLAVQRVILDLPDKELKKISHVLFFGTPSAGLGKAFWASLWNTQTHDLSNKSIFIKHLRNDWNNKFKDGINFNFKTIAGSKDEFVPVESSLRPFGNQYHGVIEGNHINMIKPQNEDDIHHQSLEIILKTLTKQKVEYLKGNAEDINILLGEYQTIIIKYLPNAKGITTKALTDLVFALECTGRNVEAMKVLQEHPEAENNSDILGIIGGRYKRKFLVDSLQTDLDNSIKYYGKALEMAQKNQDKKQIFYHAINLAFLNIVASNNYSQMEMHAKVALDNCVSENKDMFELATIAEANLYLGKLDIAEAYYRKAADTAGTDARAKQSIYSNAYYGYQSLMASKNKNVAFLKMLEDVFL